MWDSGRAQAVRAAEAPRPVARADLEPGSRALHRSGRKGSPSVSGDFPREGAHSLAWTSPGKPSEPPSFFFVIETFSATNPSLQDIILNDFLHLLTSCQSGQAIT